MFELPEAKRVRREDLNESGSSSESDEEQNAALRAQLEARLAQTFQFDLGPAASSKEPMQNKTSEAKTAAADEERKEDGEPEVFDFCLFGGAGAGPTKVVLENESETEGEGGFMEARPLSFCLASKASGPLLEQYGYAAVSGEEILGRSHRRFWGMEYPWKVTHITAVKKAGANVSVNEGNEEESAKRRRPGKKRRIALRIKERAKKEKTDAAEKQAVEKEELIKEKKKRLNRLKKLRKRAKDKEKKQAGQDAGESDGDSED